MEISARASQLTPSLTLSIDSKAKAMKAEGLDVCGFGAGEPDSDTPEHIKVAAIEALNAGFTKYTPSSGIPELRQAIAEKLAADNQLSYRPGQIIVSETTYARLGALNAPVQATRGRSRSRSLIRSLLKPRMPVASSSVAIGSSFIAQRKACSVIGVDFEVGA